MTSLRAGDCSRVLGLVAEALRCASPDFPDRTTTGLLRDLLHAEFAGVALIDLQGRATRTWADSPEPIPFGPGEFHQYAVTHPLVQAYQGSRQLTALRLSDIPDRPQWVPTAYAGSGMSHLLTIPLAITPQAICAIALMRGGKDFTVEDLSLASQVQPVLEALYALRDRLAPDHDGSCSSGAGVPPYAPRTRGTPSDGGRNDR